MITIVGLGVARGDLTLGALEALTGGGQVLLRTARTPAADVLRERGVAFSSLDALYEETEDYDEVNEAIARAVLQAAQAGDVVFGVLGGGGILDASVRAVCGAARRAGVPVRTLAGVGLYERAAAQAGGLDNAWCANLRTGARPRTQSSSSWTTTRPTGRSCGTASPSPLRSWTGRRSTTTCARSSCRRCRSWTRSGTTSPT